jgi:hypothetical protein
MSNFKEWFIKTVVNYKLTEEEKRMIAKEIVLKEKLPVCNVLDCFVVPMRGFRPISCMFCHGEKSCKKHTFVFCPKLKKLMYNNTATNLGVPFSCNLHTHVNICGNCAMEKYGILPYEIRAVSEEIYD